MASQSAAQAQTVIGWALNGKACCASSQAVCSRSEV